MKHYVLFLIIVLMGYSCVDTPDINTAITNGKKPSVTTEAPQDVKIFQATLTGNVVSNNGNVTSSRGFFIATDTIGLKTGLGKFINCGSGQGSYSGIAGDLLNGTLYYYCSFAENMDGKSYGEIRSFETGGKVWEEMPMFPGQSRIDATTFVIGGKLYLTCGSTSVSLGDTWEFNTTINTWNALSDFPSEKRRNATAFTIGQTAYVGTGQFTGSIYFNDFYSINNDSWNPTSVGSDEITPRRQAMSFGLNGKGYIVGGSSTEKNLKDVWKFSPDSNSWTRMKDFLSPITEGVGFYGENRAFIGFGIVDTFTVNQKIWEYDDISDSWISFVNIPTDMKSVSAGVLFKGKIYVVDLLNQVWELNLSTKEWKAKSMMPDVFNKYKGKQCMFATNDYIYMGLNNSCKYFYKYDPTFDN